MQSYRAVAGRIITPFVQPRRLLYSVTAIPWFLGSWRKYRQLSIAAGQTPPKFSDAHPCLTDRREAGGSASGDYFYQDIWAARKVHESGVAEHVDIASRVDGFVAHCAVFTRVIYVDIRPIQTRVPTIVPKAGSLLALPFPDRSVNSLSCLHVIEHIGLGRYGDPMDPAGTEKALNELQRVLAPGGHLYLGTPIGRPRTCFNAHRISDPARIVRIMNELELLSFAAVDSTGHLVEGVAPEQFVNQDYACGLFHFTRR
jgi:SAM-dependent methyltransferase